MADHPGPTPAPVEPIAAVAAASPRLGGASAWWMVAVLFGFYVLSWLDRLIVAILVTPIKADLALTDVQISMVTSTSFAIAYAVCGIPLGWAADRFSRRWIIFGGVLTWAAATTLCGFARSFPALLVGRTLVGIGEAALLPSAYSLISDAFPRDRITLATSTFQMAGKAGSALAFGLGAVLIGVATRWAGTDLFAIGPAKSWQLVMMMVGLPGFVAAFLVFTFPEPGRRGTPWVRGERWELLAFIRGHWQLLGLMLIGTSALAICGYSMTNWVPTYLERHFHMPPRAYGGWLSLMNLVGAASLIGTGWIVDRLYARGRANAHLFFYAWMIVALSPAVVYTFFATNVWVFLACYCVDQFITVCFMVFVSSILAILAPATVRSQMLGIFLFVFTLLGLGAGPAIVAMLTDHVFRDEALLGQSLAVVLISGSAIALLAFILALRPLRTAVIARGA